jgi:hypothetical protein
MDEGRVGSGLGDDDARSRDLADLIEPVARRLLGDPNRKRSTKTEWRYGAHGSLAVDLQKGTFFDHELGQGGGVLDLIQRETGKTGADRGHWLVDQGLLPNGDDRGRGGRGRIVATYPYHDENGETLFQVVRFEPKDFRQRRPDPTKPDGWNWSTKGVRQVPYRLPELIEAAALDKPIFIVEGERDVDRLMALGIPATTNAGGAGKWKPELNGFFAGASVVIIPDNDPQKKHPKTDAPMFHDDGRPVLPGQDHADAVARALMPVAKIKLLDLSVVWSEMPLKGDISDWLDRGGGSAEALYDLINQLPLWSPDDQLGPEPEPPPPPEPPDRGAPPIGDEQPKPKFRTLAEFISEFRPISYAVADLMREGSLYTLTGRTGEGKTAFLVMLALSIATGRETLFGRKVKQGRVAYATAENPDDLRMRLMIACFVFNIDPAIIDRDFLISDNRVRPEEIDDWLRGTGEAFTLVIVDTWQAYFDGNNSSAPAEAVAFTRRFRPLATIAGAPVVIIAAHPIKNASDDSLIPYGGGSTLNEVDGNFTILRDESGLYAFHWLGKIRGLSFDPLHFKIDKFDSPDVVTIEGERVQMPIMSPIGEEAVEERKTAIANNDIRLLEVLAEHPRMPITWLAHAAKIPRGSVDRILKRLGKKRPKIIEETLGKWMVTEAGKQALEEAKTAASVSRDDS